MAWLALGLALAMGCRDSLEERLVAVRAQQELGAYRDSIESLRRILAEYPDDPQANLLLGLAQLRLREPSLAVWPLQMASRSSAVANEANLALGGAYLQLDQYGPALEAVDRVLGADPEDFQQRAGALRLRAAVHLASEEWDAVVADTNELLALLPDDADALALRANALLGAGRSGEAETTLREIWDNPALRASAAAPKAGMGLVRLYARDFEDEARAEEQLEALLERFPVDRDVLRFAVAFFDERERPDRATRLLRAAVDEEPASLVLRAMLAERLAERGDAEAGEAVLVEGTELLGTAAAWITLAEFRREQGRHAEALAALEETLALLPTPSDPLLFKQAGLLADTGDLDAAEEVAGRISEPAYRDLILGRIAFERGDYRGALDLLDKGLRRWPNNAGARYAAGRAAIELGQLDRAMAEFREAVRVDAGATDAGIELARMQLALGNPQAALELAGRVVRHPGRRQGPRFRNAMLVMARGQSLLGQHDRARKTLAALAEREGGELLAALELAELEARVTGPEAAIEALEASGLDFADPANEPALRALCQQLVSAGRKEAALARAEAARAAHPELPAFHEIRARVLLNAQRFEEARASLEKALELEPGFAPALAALSQLAEAGGDAAGARALLDRATEADPANPAYPYEAAQLALAAGQTEAAEARLREALRRDIVHPQANNDLAWILAERGEDLEQALRLALRAVKGDPSAAVLDTLGWVQFRRGDYEAAIRSLEAAQRLEPASASIAYRLSLALLETGETARARSLLEQALASGTFPEAEQAREQLARLSEAGP